MHVALAFTRFAQWKFFLSSLACTCLILLSPGVWADDLDDLVFSVRFDKVDAVNELLQRGMSVNSVEATRGETLLMIALREKSKKVFLALLENKDVQLEARARNGDTALMLASYLGDLTSVRTLIEKGAEVNQPGWCALHYAAAGGSHDVLALLLENYAYIDAESPNKTTPLMMAARSGKFDIVTLLLDEGADITLKNDQGMTALDFAIEVEQREIAALLKERMQAPKK